MRTSLSLADVRGVPAGEMLLGEFEFASSLGTAGVEEPLHATTANNSKSYEANQVQVLFNYSTIQQYFRIA